MKFRTRVFVYAFANSAIIIVCLCLLTNHLFSVLHLEHEMEHWKYVAKGLAFESTEFVLTDDRMALLDACQRITESTPAIDYIFVERNKVVLAHTFKNGVPAGLLTLGDVSSPVTPEITPILDEHDNLFYHIRAKLSYPASTRVHLGVSGREIGSHLAPLRRSMVFLGGILLIIAPVGFGYLLSRRLAKPVLMLRRGTEKIASGELDCQLEIKTGDEIQDLAESFNVMSAKLAESYTNLEEKVRERTEALHKEINERKQAKDNLAYRLRFESLISEISTEFISLPSEQVDDAIEKALEKVAKFANADGGYIFEFLHDRTRFSMTHLWRNNNLSTKKDHLQNLDVNTMPWWMGQLVRGETVIVPSVGDLPRDAATEKNLLESQNIKSVVDVPMAYQGNVCAFMGFSCVQTKRDWTADEISLLKMVGQTFMNALQRKRFEDELRSEKDFSSRIITGSPAIICGIGADGETTFLNSAGGKITGYSLGDIIGKNWWRIFYPGNEYKQVEKLFKEFERGDVRDYEMVLTNSRGEKCTVSWNSLNQYDENEKLIQIIGIGNDITRQKRAEEEKNKLESQLRQSQKMEAIGTLAGGIAHDFNNILTPIMIQTELAILTAEKDSQIRFNLEEVLKAGHRAKDLVRQILAFSRQAEIQRVPMKLSPIIKEALKLLRSSLPATIEIRQDIEDDCGTVSADPTQIHQILMNLCTNAAHAMHEHGGVLAVILKQIHLDHTTSPNGSGPKAGSYILLKVSDSGKGINPGDLKRIFDPFFTTKSRAEGTGMGLAVVHGIVKSYGGTTTVETGPGEGATFNVYFPISESEVSHEAESIEGPLTGTERILLVDDEKIIVDSMQAMLKRLGYKLDVRTSSVEALEAFRAQPEKFDLVITDQTMPNMTGKELAKELMCIRADIPIILCTGFSEQITIEESRLMGISDYVMKPVVMDDLAKRIRTALNPETV